MTQHHRIDRFRFDVALVANGADRAHAAALQDRLTERWHTALEPVLNRALDAVEPQDAVTVVDRLEIDLGSLPLTGWEMELTTRFSTALTDALVEIGVQSPSPVNVGRDLQSTETALDSSMTRRMSTQDRQWETAVFFLENGQLPWWSAPMQVSDIESTIRETIHHQSQAVTWLREAIRKSPIRRRLAWQFSADFILDILAVLKPPLWQTRFRDVLETMLVGEGHATTRAREAALSLCDNSLSHQEPGVQMAAVLSAFSSTEQNGYMKGKAWQAIASEWQLEPEQGLASNPTHRFPFEPVDSQKPVADDSSQPSGSNLESHAKASESEPRDPKTETPRECAATENTADAVIRGSNEESNDTNRSDKNRSKFDESSEAQQKVDQRQQKNMEEITKPDEPALDDHPVAETAFAVENAGLVLLHPFLDTFLRQCGLKHAGAFPSENKERAALLLQYLVTGETVFPEFALTLNKVLCGIPVHEPLPPNIDLNRLEQEQCADLLEAVIEHWPVLKSTTTQALRDGFLQRPGLLSRTPEGWLLRVESRPHDLLLQRLPWNLSLVRYSWMDRALTIDWSDSP